MGAVTFALESLPSNKQQDSWHALVGENASGSLRIKITRVDETILPAKDYAGVAALLLNPDLAVPNLIFEANRVRSVCSLADCSLCL